MDPLRFKIDAFQPDTMPMERLAEYMAALATLLGNEKSVHFMRLDPGCVELVHSVDEADWPKVDARIAALRHNDAPADAVKAYRKLDDMLANDNAIGTLSADHQAIVLEFPGRTRPKPVDYGVFTQQGSFDGIPVKIGGLADIVPIHLQEIGPKAEVHNCLANREIARTIAAYLFETPIRVHGAGRWRREANGAWTLVRFMIGSFEVLDNSPLDAVVARLRGVPGSGWREIEHPLTVLQDLRNGEGKIH